MKMAAEGKTIGSEFDYQIIAKGGQVKTLHIAIAHVSIGGEVFAYSSFLDITERKQAEDALRQTSEKFAKIFNTSPDSITITRLSDGKYLEVNKSFTDTTGFTPEEVLGRSSLPGGAALWTNKEDRDRMVAGLTSRGEVIGMEAPLHMKNGTIITALLSARVLEIDGKKCILTIARNITERKKLDEQLRENEEKYRTLIENAGETILVAQDEKFKFINSKSLDLIGYKPEELIGKPFINYIYPEDRKMVAERYVQRLKGEEPPNNYSFRVINKAGQNRWVQMSSVWIDWQGKPATLNFLTDITESKLSEIALKESEARYRLLFDSSNDILVQIDKSMRLTDINYKAEEISGYKNEELVGKSISTLADKFTPQSIAAMLANFAKRKLGIPVGPYEVEAFDTHRNKLSFEINAVPLKDSAGKDIGEMAILHDITERKKAEELLVENEEKFRSIIESSSDQIFMLDKDNRFLLINKASASISGKAPQEMIGKSIFDIFPESTAAQFSENTKKVFETGKSFSLDETITIRGQKFYSSTKLNPIRDDRGKVTAVTGIVRDITDHIKAEEEKQKVAAAEVEKKRIKELLSIISHELRTPLTPIMVYASMFLKEKYGKLAPKYLETADIIKKESEHLQGVIQDFLDAAHVVGNVAIRLSEKRVSVKPILDELLSVIGDQFEAKGDRR